MTIDNDTLQQSHIQNFMAVQHNLAPAGLDYVAWIFAARCLTHVDPASLHNNMVNIYDTLQLLALPICMQSASMTTSVLAYSQSCTSDFPYALRYIKEGSCYVNFIEYFPRRFVCAAGHQFVCCVKRCSVICHETKN